MAGGLRTIRVWDIPTRAFHWGLVILVATSWVTQYEDWMTLHFLAGYTMLTALAFRVVWGFAGSDTARFGRFLKSPAAVARHLRQLRRREPDAEIGHNPAGGWMVLLLLALLAVQVATGLCANDEVSVQGPLADTVGSGASDFLSHVHSVNFTLIECAVVLHLVAIGTYRIVKGHRLVWPMITGKKQLPADTVAPRMVTAWFAAAVLAAAGAAVWWGVRQFGG